MMNQFRKNNFSNLGILLTTLLLTLNLGCNINSSQNKYALAERLEADKKFDAAINEYQEVVKKEPFTDLGIKAELKIAEIQHLYLGRMKEAQQSYTLVFKRTKSAIEKRRIQTILGKLAFEEFEAYDEAIRIFSDLLNTAVENDEKQQLKFLIGRAQFLKNDFMGSRITFEELQKQYPQSPYAQRAQLEIANALSASGKCREAIQILSKLENLENVELRSQAIFSEATCYEELDDLDRAYELLEKIRESFPSPQVVEFKMAKIKRRKILRKR